MSEKKPGLQIRREDAGLTPFGGGRAVGATLGLLLAVGLPAVALRGRYASRVARQRG